MTDTQPPPLTAATHNAGGEGVVVCITQLSAPGLERILPAHNHIGLQLLAASFNDAALEDGHAVSGAVVPNGELNSGFVVGIYECPAQAAQSWLGVIRRAGLSFLATLAWRDDTGQWHQVWPEGVVGKVGFDQVISPASLEASLELNRLLMEDLSRTARSAQVADLLKNQS